MSARSGRMSQTVIGANINYLLEKQGKTQVQLSKYTGSTEATVSFWCSGKRIPHSSKLKLIAAFFNVDIQSLYDESRLGGEWNRVSKTAKPTGFIIADDDSMSPFIQRYDRVFYTTQEEFIHSGSLFVVSLNGHKTVRRVFQTGDSVTLMTTNPAARPQVFPAQDAPEIIGKALYIQRNIEDM